MGATGTGKTRLSMDLAKHLQSEVINSDRIQVYKGLDIVTRKITESERQNMPHHLLGLVDPDADFAADQFCHHALLSIDHITKKGRVPIIAGGSNSYIEALVGDPNIGFRTMYDCYFGVESDDHKGDMCDKDYLLHEGIENIKANTCKLVQSQLKKIRRRMRDELGWELKRSRRMEAMRKRLGRR